MKKYLFILFFFMVMRPLCMAQHAFIKGMDGSKLSEIEDAGGKYYDNGTEKSAITILKNHGVNYWRLKLWHTPENYFNSLENVLEMAKRIKEENLGFLLDIHYSDTWADPAHQEKPSAWVGLSFEVLKDSVYQYTKNVFAALKEQNTLPDIVQIGNEITCGLLWNDGKVCSPYDTDAQWSKLGELINEGIRGAHDGAGNSQTRIMIHYNDGGDNAGCRWFYNHLLAENIQFDIIGLSFYPWWHGTLTDLENNLNDLSTRYNKDLIVVEAAYPWTLGWEDWTNNIIGLQSQLLPGYPASVDGQKQYLSDILEIIGHVSDDHGIGFFYWSPEWLPWFAGGSPWENLALFDFDGNVLESISAFEDNSFINDNKTPAFFLLENPFPNPADQLANINFSIKKPGKYTLSAFTMFGGKIHIFTDNFFVSGNYNYQWETKLQTNGMYVISLENNGQKSTSYILINH